MQRLLVRANLANQQSFRMPGLKEFSEEGHGSNGSPVALAPLAGRFSFQQLKNFSVSAVTRVGPLKGSM